MSKSKDRIKQTGEVFTPSELVNEILDKIPTDLIIDSEKTIVDPACGNGQFLFEVIKRRKTTKNVYGVDIMADNCCDTIARIIFYAIYGLNIINKQAQFVSGVNNDGHTDHPMYPLTINTKQFLRYYSYQNNEVVVIIDSISKTGVWFKYSIDGGKTYSSYPYIVCANSLEFNYDEFENIEHLDIPITNIIEIEPIKILDISVDDIIEPITVDEHSTPDNSTQEYKDLCELSTAIFSTTSEQLDNAYESMAKKIEQQIIKEDILINNDQIESTLLGIINTFVTNVHQNNTITVKQLDDFIWKLYPSVCLIDIDKFIIDKGKKGSITTILKKPKSTPIQRSLLLYINDFLRAKYNT